MIRVLVAEDSATTREYLVQLIGTDPHFVVAGEAPDGVDAVAAALRLKPDVVLMDVHMPRLDGLAATRAIMERSPVPIVLVTASGTRPESRLTFEMLRAGALAVVRKPPGPGSAEEPAAVRRLLEALRLMAEVKVVRRWPPRAPGVRGRGARIEVVAFGASTGGPPVLAEILGMLPRGFPAPVLVVQHIAPGFTEPFADWLATQTPLQVKLGEGGEAVRPGTVYLAPEGFQMELDAGARLHLAAEDAHDGFRPSVSHLFTALARSQGAAAMGVLLSGMGRDGAAGLLALRAAGGLTVAQSEATSAVFGMPGEAVRRGAAEHVLSPPEIGALVREAVGEGGRR